MDEQAFLNSPKRKIKKKSFIEKLFSCCLKNDNKDQSIKIKKQHENSPNKKCYIESQSEDQNINLKQDQN